MTIGFRLPPDVEPASLAEDVEKIARSAGLALVTRPSSGDVSGVIGQQGLASRNRDDVHTARRTNGEADSEKEVNCLTFSGEEVAFRSDKNNPLVRAFLASIRQSGGQPRFVLKTGTADMNVVGPGWRVPIVAYGPGDSALDHTPEERINLTEYLRSIEVIKNVLGMLQRSAA
jgi:acetylornithine deacetylase/succinyl-diaminopimelate desuccinylase-like protein